MAPATGKSGKTESPSARLNRLRAEVEQLKVDPVAPAVADLTARGQRAIADVTSRGQHAVGAASATMQGRVRAFSGQVEQRPFITILVAGAVGYVLSRVV